MRKLTIILYFILSASISRAQTSSGFLDIVSWNVEWFGSPTQGPADDNLQEANVKTMLHALHADLYALVEVVDTARLRRLANSLGSDYGYVVSPYCSGNATGLGSAWLN